MIETLGDRPSGYMRKISEVAALMANKYSDLDTLGKELHDSWTRLHREAERLGWDVLRPTLSFDEELRMSVRQLTRLLYHVPGAEAASDCRQLEEKDGEYGGSWCKRGGCGAFMMAARKWDRVELQLRKHDGLATALAVDKRQEGILDDLGDLRRYLLLWEAWHFDREEHEAESDSAPF